MPWDPYKHPRLLKEYLGPKGFLVAMHGRRVIGFLHYRIFRKRPWFDPEVRQYGQILELHIMAKYHGRGIGTRLMRQALSQLAKSKCQAIYTNTDETNKPALNLYRSFGFAPFLKTFFLKRPAKLPITRRLARQR